MTEEKTNNYMTPKALDEMVKQFRVGNVRIVNDPVYGRTYICPFPPEHFPEAIEEAKKVRFSDIKTTDKNKLA